MAWFQVGKQGGCDWNAGSPYVSTIDVPTTDWTPAGSDGNDAWEQSEYGWPSNANDNNNLIVFKGGGTFNECISLIAMRNDARRCQARRSRAHP